MRKTGKGRSGKRFGFFCMAAVMAAAVMLGGCRRQSDRIAATEGAEEGRAAVEYSVGDTAGNAAEGVAVGDTSDVRADTSIKEVVIVTETGPSMENVDETVYVTGNGVNLRASASTSGEILAVFHKGEKLHRTGLSDGWSRVQYNGMVCYISSRYVSVLEPAAEETSAGTSEAASAAAAGISGPAEVAPSEASGTGSGAISAPSDITLDLAWKYADLSKIHSGAARLYKSEAAVCREITVCVNAGHGTSGGSGVKTLCHPDGSPKVTGGTTSAGATTAVAVSGGMTFDDGTPEHKVTLAMAMKLKDKLLAAGYDVVMIRESDDVQLDNIARTVIANNSSHCHIALHWDSTSSNKGAFYMSVPSQSSYRNMEPVKSNWEKHNALGESLIAGLQNSGVKIFSNGAMEMDLTQTSYSTIPSVDIELGDKASDHSDSTLNTLADGLLAGINQYFDGRAGS